LDDDGVRGDPQSTPGDPDDAPAMAAGAEGALRRRTVWEIWIVLGLSLGQSAVYAVISLVAKLTAGPPLAAQTATVNRSVSPRPYLDLTYQLTGIVFTVVPVLLVLWLLASGTTPGSLRTAARRIGLDGPSPWRDLGHGALLAAVIGLPGLAFYYLGRQLGITAEVVAAALTMHWWAVPVLLLQALKNALLEEVIVVAYLSTRLRGLGWPAWAIVGASAVLRGAYHLYQGFGPFLGNVVMGVVFAEWFRRRGRVMPLVLAHALLDVVAFVGYQLFLR
jgi:membrane protease YdiL (CAAX protease family)